MDIKAKATPPASQLSNFEPYAFIFDGVNCASMEGLVQSFKVADHERQKVLCMMTGKQAKEFGQAYNALWKSTQLLWWKGKSYAREGAEYQGLLDRAFAALATNKEFQRVLLSTGAEELTHSIGSHDPKDTVLTEEEFCSRLMRARATLAHPAPAVETTRTYACSKCHDTGVIETGNNNLPCSCAAGDAALFNEAGIEGLVTGKQVRRHFLNDSPKPIIPGRDAVKASDLPK